jgi:ligand-binding sensor domain-containing protein
VRKEQHCKNTLFAGRPSSGVVHAGISKFRLPLFFLVFSWLGIAGQNLIAQDFLYETKNYLVDPTLSDNQVNSMVQDRSGLIWVSTKRGVARFNGYQFDVFEGGDKDLDMPRGNVYKLEIAGDNLFIASEKGLLVLNTSSFKMERLKGDPSVGHAVFDIVQTGTGTIYWCSKDGYLYRKRGTNITRYRLPFTYAAVNLSLQLHGPDIYVFDLYQGLITVDTNTLQLKKRFRITSEIKNNKMLIDRQGRLLCITGEDVYLVDGDRGELVKHDSLGRNIDDVLYVDNGQFVVKNRSQVWHQYGEGQPRNEQQIETDISTPFRIYKLYNVNRQIVGASTEGLIIIQYTPKRFTTIYSTYNKDRNSYDVPRGIVEDSSHYFLGTYYSLGVFDKEKQTLFNAVKEPLSIHWALKEEDTIWLATEGNGLMKYLVRTRKALRVQPRNDGKQVYLKCMVKWGQDSFLLGGYQYLFLYDRTRQVFSRPEIKYKGMLVSDLDYNHLIRVDGDQMLMATNRGVFRINRNREVLQHYRAKYDTLYNDNDYVNAMWVAPNKSIWAGTSNGVLQFDSAGKLMHHFTRGEGLAGNKIASIVADRNQNLWVSTFTGLSCINKRNFEISNYFMEDGLPDNEFNRSSFLLSGNGDILLGTVKGFIRFSPRLFETPPKVPGRVAISKIVYGSQNGEYQEYSPNKADSGSIRLGKQIDYVKIFFFSNPVEVQKNPLYEYKIEGIHPNWVSMGNTPVLHLDNVKTGKYTLRVRMISGYGSKGILESSFPLVVQQYFYTTPWFYVLMVGTLFGLIIGYIKLLLAREKKMREVRRDISQDLHDEIGSYLTGISMNMDLMKKNKDKEHQYKQTIRLLGKKSLLALKDGLWSLDPGSDTAEQLWDRIKSITKETLEPLDIGYAFTDPPGLQHIRLTMLEKRNLVFIIKECITNSIKYGDGHMVDFAWQSKKGRHAILIQNKIGDSTSRQEGGQGLAHIRNRMQRIGGEASFHSDGEYFNVTLQLLFIHDRIRHYRR